MEPRTLVLLDRTLYALIALLFVVLPFSLAGLNIISGLMLLVLLAKIIVQRELSFITKPEHLPALVLVGVGLISALTAVDVREGIKTFLSPLLKYYVVYIAVANSVRTEKRLGILLGITLVVGAITAGFGIYQHLILSVNRISSFFNNPNPAGSYFAMYTMISLSLLVVCKKKIYRIGMVLPVALGAMATVFTLSRGAFLGLIVSLVVLAFILAKNGAKKILPFAILIALVISIALPTEVVHRFELDQLISNSNQQRIYMFETAWKMFKESPLFGKGPGSFRVLYPVYKHPQAWDGFDHAHNIYLHIMAEIGVLGLAAFLWVAGVLAKRTARIISCEGSSSVSLAAALSALLSCVAVAVHGLVDATFLDSQVGVLMCLLAGTVGAVNPGRSNNCQAK